MPTTYNKFDAKATAEARDALNEAKREATRKINDVVNKGKIAIKTAEIMIKNKSAQVFHRIKALKDRLVFNAQSQYTIAEEKATKLVEDAKIKLNIKGGKSIKKRSKLIKNSRKSKKVKKSRKRRSKKNQKNQNTQKNQKNQKR